jgi:hypothetical protein
LRRHTPSGKGSCLFRRRLAATRKRRRQLSADRDISRSGHRHAEPDDPRHFVERSQMLRHDPEYVERGEVSRLAPRFHIEFGADAPNKFRPVGNRWDRSFGSSLCIGVSTTPGATAFKRCLVSHLPSPGSAWRRHREQADEERTFDVDGNKRPQIVDRVIREVLREIYAGVVDERVDPIRICSWRLRRSSPPSQVRRCFRQPTRAYLTFRTRPTW